MFEPALPGRRLGGQRFGAEVGEQRVEAEAALVVAGRLLLLGVGGDQGRVDVDDELVGAGAGGPGRRTGPRPRRADPLQAAFVDGAQDPVDGGLGGDRSEQVGLAAEDAEVGDAVAAVGDRDGEVAEDDAGLVGRAALSGRRHRRREGRGEAEPVAELGEQEGAGVGDQAFAVRANFYLCAERFRFHLRGVLSGSRSGFSNPHSQAPGGRPGGVLLGRYRWIEANELVDG